MALAEPHYERLDLKRRDIVNHGISVQESSNTMAAVEYLKAHDIDAGVIERVLLEPQRRRRNAHH
jgi:hypothetical protein